MNQYEIRFSKLAKSDLRGIYRYLSGCLMTPRAVSDYTNAVENEITGNLSFAPYYAFVDDARLSARGYRRMVVKKYLVFFVIDEEKSVVKVRRIIHGARDWQRILSNE